MTIKSSSEIAAKKSILIFSTAYLPLIGGAEIAVKEITQRLRNSQFDMITAKIQPGLAKFEKIGNVNVYRLGWGCFLDKYFLPFLGLLKAKSLYKKQHYNLIWAVMASYGGLAALFFKLKKPDIPFLLTLQEGDSPEHIQRRARWLGPMFKKIFQKADYIQAISNYLKKWAIEMGASCSIDIVPNGVDISKFQIPNSKFQINSKSQIQNFKKKLGIEESDKIVLTVSRLVPKNGIADLIDGVNELRIMNPELGIKLLIIGDGPLEKKLKLRVTSYELRNCVVFLGTIPYDELPQYYALADVFVRPSLSEGLGSAFLEAMAAGIPIIGTAVGGIPDFLVDEETGLFCQARNPKSIAEKIKLLLTDDSLRQKVIANGRKLVKEKYTWNKIAQRMQNIFNNIRIISMH